MKKPASLGWMFTVGGVLGGLGLIILTLYMVKLGAHAPQWLPPVHKLLVLTVAAMLFRALIALLG